MSRRNTTRVTYRVQVYIRYTTIFRAPSRGGRSININASPGLGRECATTHGPPLVESPKSKIHSQIKHWSTNLNSGRHYGLGRCPLPSPGRICKILTCGCQFIPRRQCSPVAQLGLEAIVHSNSASGICPTMITHRSTRDVKGAFFFFFFFCWWARITFPWSFGSVPGWSSQGEDSNNEQ